MEILSAEPAPPANSDQNAWTVKLTDADAGAPIEGATLIVAPYMPQHGHGAPNIIGGRGGRRLVHVVADLFEDDRPVGGDPESHARGWDREPGHVPVLHSPPMKTGAAGAPSREGHPYGGAPQASHSPSWRRSASEGAVPLGGMVSLTTVGPAAAFRSMCSLIVLMSATVSNT